MTDDPTPRLYAAQGEPDQVPRLLEFRRLHPEVTIAFGGPFWQAIIPEAVRRDGDHPIRAEGAARQARRAAAVSAWLDELDRQRRLYPRLALTSTADMIACDLGAYDLDVIARLAELGPLPDVGVLRRTPLRGVLRAAADRTGPAGRLLGPPRAHRARALMRPPADGTQFSALIQELLADRGWTLGELARRSCYDKGYVSKVLNGRKRGSPELAAHLDRLLGAGGEPIF